MLTYLASTKVVKRGLFNMTSQDELIAGSFYWAIPAWDCDAEEKWEMDWQPARYLGNDKWQWINSRDDDWPAAFVGRELECE